MPNILGISAHFHDAACCLLQDGCLVAAAQEEAFSRRKHDPAFPKNAAGYCLEQGNITIMDVDLVAYYENPVKRVARQLSALGPRLLEDRVMLRRLDSRRPENEIRMVLGYEKEIYYTDHHLAHAASAFYLSGFSKAAV